MEARGVASSFLHVDELEGLASGPDAAFELFTNSIRGSGRKFGHQTDL
jgi:hypothetical protein